MRLQFTENVPGVHVATWQDPSNGAFRTIVIVKSLDGYSLYVDSEVVARELHTFESARVKADSVIASSRSAKMVQIAAALVAISLIGGSAVGIGHMLGSGPALAIMDYRTSVSKFVPKMSLSRSAPEVKGSRDGISKPANN